MSIYYEPNASPYWCYSPYSYSQSFETSSSTSSSVLESPTDAASPRVMPMYYYPCPPVAPPPSVTHQPNRLQYSVRQRWLLNEIFRRVPYPNSVQKNVVADRIGATREQIRKFLLDRVERRIFIVSLQAFGFRIDAGSLYKAIVALLNGHLPYLINIVRRSSSNWKRSFPISLFIGTRHNGCPSVKILRHAPFVERGNEFLFFRSFFNFQ